MIWTVDETSPRSTYNKGQHEEVPAAGMKKYYEWRNMIVTQNCHPKIAAENVGDMWYKKLMGGSEVFEIRLTQKHRVFFRVNSTSHVVTIDKVGGHI